MRVSSIAGAIVTIVAAAGVLSPRTDVAADDELPIRVVESGVVSEFSEGMRFSIKVESDYDVEEISVKFRVGQQDIAVYEYFDFDLGKSIDSELFWRTAAQGKYIPPGTIISYSFLIDDTEGNRFETEPVEFIYVDARFDWQEVSEGPIAVAYHGPVKTRAETILQAILDTMEVMGPILGADTSVPIRVTMYNNVKEMLEALPPGSTTIRRELITEGQAFTNVGTLLVLGGGRRAKGTASHEVTHILTHRAGDSIIARVPSWLDEGLAEFGNVDPGFSYDIALEFAIGTDRVLPITSMPVLPGDPEDVIIFYGQASSVVRFMVGVWGPAAMRELMRQLKEGTNIEVAIEQIYGMSRIELENRWREIVGAPEYVVPDRESAKPTPIARRAVGLFSLTPQAGTETVSTIDTTPTPTAEPSTATPAPTATALPEPTVPPPPPPTATAPPTPDVATDAEDALGAAGCSSPGRRGAGIGDLAMPLLAFGLVGLALHRRGR